MYDNSDILEGKQMQILDDNCCRGAYHQI